IYHLTSTCNFVEQQLKDDLIIRQVEKSVDLLANVVNSFGTIWLCGSSSGLSTALYVNYKLSTTISRFERPTRSLVLGLNPILSSTADNKGNLVETLAEELFIQGRKNDILWCFCPDVESKLVLNALIAAYKIKIPTIVFTTYPGAPLIKFATLKILIQSFKESDHAGYCTDQAHFFLASIICNHLKRISRRIQLNTND
ncbi:MAG: hypothetical protein D6813_00490, partial [Calditrichaeota bacterium]